MAQKNDSSKRPETVRGPELRKKIEDSQVMGEQYRSENQGADTIDTNVLHNDNTTRHRSSEQHNSKK